MRNYAYAAFAHQICRRAVFGQYGKHGSARVHIFKYLARIERFRTPARTLYKHKCIRGELMFYTFVMRHIAHYLKFFCKTVAVYLCLQFILVIIADKLYQKAFGLDLSLGFEFFERFKESIGLSSAVESARVNHGKLIISRFFRIESLKILFIVTVGDNKEIIAFYAVVFDKVFAHYRSICDKHIRFKQDGVFHILFDFCADGVVRVIKGIRVIRPLVPEIHRPFYFGHSALDISAQKMVAVRRGCCIYYAYSLVLYNFEYLFFGVFHPQSCAVGYHKFPQHLAGYAHYALHFHTLQRFCAVYLHALGHIFKQGLVLQGHIAHFARKNHGLIAETS